MSTNSECEFFEPEAGKWYYALQRWDAPHNAWDWRDYADTFGPFSSEDEAFKHLRNNHANPGGYSTTPHEEFKTSETYSRLVSDAQSPSDRGFGLRY